MLYDDELEYRRANNRNTNQSTSLWGSVVNTLFPEPINPDYHPPLISAFPSRGDHWVCNRAYRANVQRQPLHYLVQTDVMQPTRNTAQLVQTQTTQSEIIQVAANATQSQPPQLQPTGPGLFSLRHKKHKDRRSPHAKEGADVTANEMASSVFGQQSNTLRRRK